MESRVSNAEASEKRRLVTLTASHSAETRSSRKPADSREYPACIESGGQGAIKRLIGFNDSR
jgi:hypothetical protein